MSNVFLFTFFFTRAHFHLGGRQHFSFSHLRYKIFMLFFQQKMSPLLFFSRSSSLPLIFSLSFAGLSPTFSFSILQIKFVDMTINLSLIPQTTGIQKQFPVSVSVFIESLVVSASQDAAGYAISHQNNLELYLLCQLPYLFIELFYVGMPVMRTDGRTVT